MIKHWAISVWLNEISQTMIYRLQFWIKFLLSNGTDLLIAYFIWNAIFEANAATTLNGFNLKGLIFYYVFSSLSSQIGQGDDRGHISLDIYSGGLTKYLVYPISFFRYKYVIHLSRQALGVVKLLITAFLFLLFLGKPDGSNFTVFTFAAGLFTCIFTGYLNFVIVTCIETVAFWQDVIWNLLAMWRFTLNLLGGALIPLAFFPDWSQRFLAYTPFPYLITFPARTFLGELGLNEWIHQFLILGFWALFFTVLGQFFWRKGLKQYSGVGI